MPNYNPDSEGFSDLETGLRQNRPQNDPMSPAFKRQLRANLLEAKRMNKAKFNLGQLATAVAALILIVGIPIFFWSIQASLSGGTGAQPDGAVIIEPNAVVEEPIVEETAVPTVTIESGEVEEPETDVADSMPLAEAVITDIGLPVRFDNEQNGAPPGMLFNVAVTVDYTLQGYEEALLIITSEVVELNGSSGSQQTLPISLEDAGSVTVEFMIDSNYLDEAGNIREEVEFSAHINWYDEALGHYVNIFPGDLQLSEQEQNAAYPLQTTTEFLGLDAITLHSTSEGETVVTLTLLANVGSQPEGTVTAVITANNGTVATGSTAVSQVNSVVTLPLTVTAVTENTPLHIEASLTVGEEERTVFTELAGTELIAPVGKSVWIVSAAAEPGPNNITNLTFVVGYKLDASYTGGIINHSASFFVTGGGGGASGSGGGGGGGSGGSMLPVGTGMTTIRFGFSSDDLTVDNWQELLSVQISLLGISDEGSQTLVDEVVFPSPTE